jgi:hexosaminidase
MFPVPRLVERRSGPGSAEEREVVVDATLPAQGYVLDVADAGTSVTHADDAGLRYARQTLARLAATPGLEAQRVVDHPDHLVRGYMLDVSRDRVPTEATLRWLVGVLAELRYNHLELYMEHTFAYADHREVWERASPLTADELRRLDDLCAEHGIELVANQNTFGHMERWLRHDRHRSRAECPDGASSPFTGRPMPPATLAPTAANADFAVDLVRELAGHLRSRTVNVGADEPFELGQGASADAVAARGRASVYLEHLDRILRPLIEDGHHVLFWGDILRRHPDLVAQLPPSGATAVVWSYEAPADDAGVLGGLGPELLDTLGLPDDHHRGFVAHTRSFVETGYPFWVAGGTSSWNTLIGRWSNARGNLLDASVVGRDLGATGFLVTDWGDNGHLQPLVVSLLPLAYGAGVAWCADTNADADATLVVDRLAGAPGLGALLADLGDADQLSGVRTFNGSPLLAALDPTRPLPHIGKGEPDGHRATIELLEQALTRVEALPPGVLVDSLRAAVRLARHGAWRLAARAGMPVPDAAALEQDASQCRELQRGAWLATSRPGGLDDSLEHLP